MKIRLPILDIDLHPYAGKYIALVAGRVVAVAGSADDARALAQMTRPQRQPVILYISPLESTSDSEETSA